MMRESSSAARDAARPSGEQLGREFSAAVVRFHEAVARRRGLSAADNKTLDLLDREGPMTPGELAARIGVTAGAVTGLIDRLQAGQFVERQPDQRDRRRILVHVTDQHIAAMNTAFAPMTKALQTLLGTYTPSESATVLDFLARAREILEREATAIESTTASDR